MPQILSLEWFDNGREQELVVPVLSYLHHYLGYEIICCSAFDTLKVLTSRPDAVLIAGVEGSARQTEWAKRFTKTGTPVFGITTEGIFNDQVAREFIWGHTPKKGKLLWTKRFLWNEPSLKITELFSSEIAQVSVVTGNPAADKYVMQNLINRNRNNQKNFRKKIGIALTDAIASERMISRDFPQSLDKFLSSLRSSIQILINFIRKNPEYNFIIRKHPADNQKSHKLYEELTKIKNVEFQSEGSSLSDFLSQSSVLLVFNSSLVVDANLLGIPSIKVGNMEPPGKYYEHIPVAHHEDDLKKILTKIYKRKAVSGPINNELIRCTYGNADGINHKRIAMEINKIVAHQGGLKTYLFKTTPLKEVFREILSWYLHKLILVIQPSIKMERFDRIKKYDANKIYQHISDYYQLQKAYFSLKNKHFNEK